ncbi:4767_t:CDS:2, partial [Funneliformis geosporum]
MKTRPELGWLVEEFCGGETAYEGKVCRSCLGKKQRGEATSSQAQNQRATDEPPFYMNRDYGFKESRKVNSSGKKILLRELNRKQKTMKVQALNNPGARLTSTIPFRIVVAFLLPLVIWIYSLVRFFGAKGETERLETEIRELEGSEPDLQVNLGEQQRQQVREVTSQLVGNILDNQNNFSQLTTNPNGARRNIDEIEEIFLSGSLNQQPQSPTTPAPTQITNSLSFELLEEHLKLIQGLKTIRELFEKYSQIRTNLVINKVDRSKELIGKGYSDIDVAQLKDTITTDRRTGKVLSKKITGGSSRKLLLFLKPSKNHSSTVYFPPDKIEKAQQNSVRKVIKSLLENQSAKLERIQNYDIYILRVDSSHDGAGPSSGVAHYLALYSALNKVPLPSNLASTGTIKGTKVGAIGGLQHKLEASVENGIDIFILSHKNKKSTNQEESFDDTPHNVENKIKQVHFISQVDQIEIALNEILDNTVKEKVHICNKDKTPDEQPEKPEQREPPEKPEQPNSKITSEQLLSLITELNIREKGRGTKGSISLQKEYEEKIAELSKPRNPNQ